MKIKVVTYNPEWPQQFIEEAASIEAVLLEIVLRVHHIGSTAVPGLVAKPIIDILLEVASLEQLDAHRDALVGLGYEVMGEFGIPGRRYFRKGGDQRTHHVHAFMLDDPNVQRHLAFRDYLRAHPTVAKAYGMLKMDIARQQLHDMGTYSEKKDPFIKLHEAKALAWYRQ